MTDPATVAAASQVRAGSDRRAVAESSLSTAAEGDFTSLVTNPSTETRSSHRRKSTRETPCCGRTIGSDWARAQALFSPEAVEHGMFRARSGGPLRTTRADAEQDEHFALSPSCAVVAGVRR